jgi:hypothetical protein
MAERVSWKFRLAVQKKTTGSSNPGFRQQLENAYIRLKIGQNSEKYPLNSQKHAHTKPILGSGKRANFCQ